MNFHGPLAVDDEAQFTLVDDPFSQKRFVFVSRRVKVRPPCSKGQVILLHIARCCPFHKKFLQSRLFTTCTTLLGMLNKDNNICRSVCLHPLDIQDEPHTDSLLPIFSIMPNGCPKGRCFPLSQAFFFSSFVEWFNRSISLSIAGSFLPALWHFG